MAIEDMSELVETGGAAPAVAVAPHAIPIQHSIFVKYREIAEREKTTPAVVINDVLRAHLGET